MDTLAYQASMPRCKHLEDGRLFRRRVKLRGGCSKWSMREERWQESCPEDVLQVMQESEELRDQLRGWEGI